MKVHSAAQIHPLAHVSDATIGARTRVWQFASVIRGAKLGDDCNVASCATIDGSVFGDRCIICQGAAMGPGFRFGDDCFVGPNVTICNDAWPSAAKSGGGAGGEWNIEPFQSGEWAVIAEDGVSIGANAVVLPGVRLGSGCVVAAGAVVTGDIPARCLWMRDGTIRPLPSRRKRMRFAAEPKSIVDGDGKTVWIVP